ncbi:predicted protein [Histoplasma capsulatum var. duboisii H88]|uniref:Predicted protein n=1 Tax=Ajellomyces capsulatus (strain H88) TaxID=544711 RepID=F0UCL7_AJEC8|nr:predicted protein [Histoplasma capsulatum var. duboisii H88]
MPARPVFHLLDPLLDIVGETSYFRVHMDQLGQPDTCSVIQEQSFSPERMRWVSGMCGMRGGTRYFSTWELLPEVNLGPIAPYFENKRATSGGEVDEKPYAPGHCSEKRTNSE